MDWIAGKMKENLTGGREFVSYIDGKFSYKKEWKTSIYCVTTIDLNNVLGMNSEYSADFFVSGKNLTFVHCDNDKPDQGSYKEYLSISGPNYKDYTAPFNFTPDATLVERLKKAVAVLIQYNAPKKGENESFWFFLFQIPFDNYWKEFGIFYNGLLVYFHPILNQFLLLSHASCFNLI